jgi:hypothetical protein
MRAKAAIAVGLPTSALAQNLLDRNSVTFDPRHVLAG